jgi:ketosteroid isomerase-like protein
MKPVPFKIPAGAITLFFIVAVAACQTADRPTPELQSLIDAERSFAAAAMEKGIRDSFLEYLAEGSVVFHPVPADARQAYSAREIIPGILSWEPAFAEIAASGDLGYTIGPYEFRAEESGDDQVSNGYYISVWHRPDGGEWRVKADIGTVNPPPPPEWQELTFRNPDPRAEPGPEAMPLDRLEHELAERGRSDGAAAAYREFAAADIRIFRMGADHPTVGLEEVTEPVPSGLATGWSIEPGGSGRADSGDIGFTFGILSAEPEKFSFLRIWRREGDGKFRIAVDVLLLIPPPEAGSS